MTRQIVEQSSGHGPRRAEAHRLAFAEQPVVASSERGRPVDALQQCIHLGAIEVLDRRLDRAALERCQG
jgi:hypothetical protein